MQCTCGGIMKESETIFDGFIVKCLKCDKCGNTSFTPEHTKELMELKEFSNKISGTRRVVIVGDSMAVTLPSKLKAMGLEAGALVDIKLLGANSIQVKFKKQGEK
jgi:hypothetical protein